MANKICPSCGRECSPRAKKCAGCGALIDTVASQKDIEGTPAGTATIVKPVPSASKAPKYKLPDKTASSCAGRFALHTLLSVLGFGVAFLLGGLVIDILEDLFAPEVSLATFMHTAIFMSCSAAIVALICGIVGPIATYDYTKENSYKIVRARPRPFYLCALSYLAISVAALVYHLILRARYADQISTTSEANIILPLALSLAAAIYYLVYTVTSLLHIKGAVCTSCGHVSCKIKIGESQHGKTEKYETRQRTYAGASYDVYSGGTHVGTITGPDTTVTESRKVTTETWDEYFECIHCKHRSTSGASKKEKEKWS